MKFSAHTIEGKTTFCLVTFALMKLLSRCDALHKCLQCYKVIFPQDLKIKLCSDT